MPQETKKRVFLSFIAEDRGRVEGLRLLAKNPNFDIEFYDESVRTPFDSQDAEYIKRRIREKINRTSVTVCLISEETHKSKWVDWELRVSDEKGNKIIAMALKGVKRAVLPRLIEEKGLTFHAWDLDKLARLITEWARWSNETQPWLGWKTRSTGTTPRAAPRSDGSRGLRSSLSCPRLSFLSLRASPGIPSWSGRSES